MQADAVRGGMNSTEARPIHGWVPSWVDIAEFTDEWNRLSMDNLNVKYLRNYLYYPGFYLKTTPPISHTPRVAISPD